MAPSLLDFFTVQTHFSKSKYGSLPFGVTATVTFRKRTSLIVQGFTKYFVGLVNVGVLVSDNTPSFHCVDPFVSLPVELDVICHDTQKKVV